MTHLIEDDVSQPLHPLRLRRCQHDLLEHLRDGHEDLQDTMEVAGSIPSNGTWQLIGYSENSFAKVPASSILTVLG